MKKIISVLGVSILLSGCSTVVCNADKNIDNKVYCGIELANEAWAIMPTGPFDIPLSIVADTLMLPYTIPATMLASDEDDAPR
uniref:YceK/YidQ family lipoprotein n=1 Tax=Thaumasiovibrio occultus TaxID=1891184 RepID=UPI000B35D506|nr:YceK/YidQ family lipoprotein [Thaumasiovibrio occultus]